MAVDIVPELLASIERQFGQLCAKDTTLLRLSRKIDAGRATFEDAHRYSQRLGELLSRTLTQHYSSGLPDDRLYYNIAERTIVPMLQRVHGLVVDYSTAVQELDNVRDNIHIAAVAPEFPLARVEGLAQMASDEWLLEYALDWVGEPIINNSEAFVDDFVQANAARSVELGLAAVIVRKAEPGACKWCQALSGTWSYPVANDDLFRRHESCRCTTTYKRGRTRQDVWSKADWRED